MANLCVLASIHKTKFAVRRAIKEPLECNRKLRRFLNNPEIQEKSALNKLRISKITIIFDKVDVNERNDQLINSLLKSNSVTIRPVGTAFHSRQIKILASKPYLIVLFPGDEHFRELVFVCEVGAHRIFS